MTEYREGDVVSIEATVKFTAQDGGSVYLDLPGHFNAISVKTEAVKMVRPHFEIGEAVIYDNGVEASETGRILGVADDEVWIELGNGKRWTVPIGKVERKPTPIVEAAPVANGAEAAG